MIVNLNEVLSADQFVGFLENLQQGYGLSLELEGLFPVKKMDGLDYSYIKGGKSAIELSTPSAFDAEPIVQHRKGFNAMKGELPLFRKKMFIGEKEKQKLKTYMKISDQPGIRTMLTQIYDDQKTLVEGAQMTMEFLRAKALMDGKITLESKGGAVNVDYKVPAGNKYVLTSTSKWDDVDAKVLDNIKDWCEKVEEETGVRPTKMIMNRTTFKHFRNNNQVRNNLLPLSLLATASVKDSLAISDRQIVSTIEAYTGLTEIRIYNKKVQYDGVNHDLIEDNKISIYPEGGLGNTMIGTSPAELNAAEANASGAGIAVTGDGIAVNVYTKTGSPYTTSTEVEFIGLPSFEKSESVVLATVA